VVKIPQAGPHPALPPPRGEPVVRRLVLRHLRTAMQKLRIVRLGLGTW
jgi:hypothetical protein